MLVYSASRRFESRISRACGEYSASIFDPARVARQVDELARAIRAAVGDESAAALVRFDRAVGGESLPPILFNGRPFGAPNPIVPIKGFVPARARAVKTQLVRIEGGTE